MSLITIRVTPGSSWDQFWAGLFHRPTLAWEETHITVDRHDLQLALDTGDPDAVTRLREALGDK